MSITEIFSKSVPLKVIRRYDKKAGLLYRFDKCLGRFHMLTGEECSETGLFKHLSTHVFHSL